MALSEFEIKKVEKAVFEIRPVWNNPSEFKEYPFAKASFVKSKGIWKIYWLRQNLKWNSYEPTPQVKSIESVFSTVSSDEHGCFFG